MPDAQSTELRIALAMNGGVSLAIWIGGVNNELLRLVDAGRTVSDDKDDKSNPYVAICRDLNVVPVVDVITGASAGGLNGVFLALGIVNEHSSLEKLRDLWIKSGSFEKLLRSPTDASLPSLLKGDDYFLVELREAVDSMFGKSPRDYDGASPNTDSQRDDRMLPPPVHVRLTTTSLPGTTTTIRDPVSGNELYDTDHHAYFKFEEADFHRPSDAEGADDLVTRLARACRSTASFPGAFEPSFVDAELFGDKVVGVDRDAYVVDGGVLANLPAQQAIRGIVDQPSREQVARVLALVVPDPGGSPAGYDTDPTSKPTAPPITGVITASVVGIPRVQSLHVFLDELDGHNADVDTRHAARTALLRSLAPTGTSPEAARATLHNSATSLFDAYRGNRITSAVESVSRRLVDLLTKRRATSTEGLRADIDALLFQTDAPTVHDLVWARRTRFKFVPASLEPSPARATCWGSTTITRIVPVLVTLVNEARKFGWLADSTFRSLKRELSAVRNDAQNVSPREGVLADSVMRDWLAARAVSSDDTPQADLETALDTAIAEWPDGNPDGVATLNSYIATLGRIAHDLVAAIDPNPPDVADDDTVPSFARLLSGADAAEAARVLLDLEVLECAFAGFEARNEQHIELVQITSRSVAPVDTSTPPRADADEKLAGVQLGHFGAFLKRSWRANDWLWGRLDAATRLVTLLSEKTSDSARTNDDTKQRIVAVQLAILKDELDALVDAIDQDVKDGSPMTEDARAFMREAQAVQNKYGCCANAPDNELQRLHQLNRIGQERLPDEIHSDLAVRTSVKALATATTVANRSGPKLLAGPTKSARSVSVLAYYLVRLTDGQRRAAAVLIGLVLGVAITAVGVDLFVQDIGALATVGWLAIAAVLVLAALRNPLLTVPLLVLSVVPGLLSTLPTREDGPSWWPATVVWPRVPGWVGALAFVLGFVLIGSMRSFPWLDEQAKAVKCETKRLRELCLHSWLLKHWWPGLVLLFVTGVVVAAKGLFLGAGIHWWPHISGSGIGDLLTRNLVAAGIVAVLVVFAVNRRQVGRALGIPPWSVASNWLGVVVAWGVPLIGLVLATAALLCDGGVWPRIALLVGATVMTAVAVVRLAVERPRSDAQAWLPVWSVVPATLVVIGFAIAAFGKGDRTQDVTELLGVLLGTALLEEFVFRGGLMSLSIRTGSRFVRLLVPGLAFGLWHLTDAIHDAHSNDWSTTFDVFFVMATVLAMAIVSWLVLEPLRLRCRSIVGPWLLHAAVNGSLIALGFASPLATHHDASASTSKLPCAVHRLDRRYVAHDDGDRDRKEPNCVIRSRSSR